MPALQTQARDNKIQILKQIDGYILELLIYPKSRLDKIDMRDLKKLLQNIEDMKNRAKPLS